MPVAALTTLTLIEHWLLPPKARPLPDMVLPPATAVMVPPQALTTAGIVLVTTPAG